MWRLHHHPLRLRADHPIYSHIKPNDAGELILPEHLYRKEDRVECQPKIEELLKIRAIFPRMQEQIESWEDEEPREDWWQYQRDFECVLIACDGLCDMVEELFAKGG